MKAARPKKRGRPATGRDPLVQVRVPKSMLDRIDRWAGRFNHMDRSTALRCLLNLGLGRSRSRPAQVIDPKGCKTHHSNRRAVIRKHVSEEPTLPTISTTVENPKNLTERRRLVLIKGASS